MKMIRVLTFILLSVGCMSAYGAAAHQRALTQAEEDKIVNEAGCAGAKAAFVESTMTGLLAGANVFFTAAMSNRKALPHFWRAPWWDATASLVTMGVVAGIHYYRNSKEASKVKRFEFTPLTLSIVGATQSWFESIALDKSPRLNLTLCTGAALLAGQGLHSLWTYGKRKWNGQPNH